MITDRELGPEKPIAVSFNAQDIGHLYMMNGGPEVFMQELLTRFQGAGVPVEGTIRKRLKHGQVFKVKDSPKGRGFFDYVWLPESYVAAIAQMGGLKDSPLPPPFGGLSGIAGSGV